MLFRKALILVATVNLSLAVLGCGTSGSATDASSSDNVGLCKNQSSSYSGCCSSHGGVGGQCPSGQVCYTLSGSVVCTDGTVSPTCTYDGVQPENRIANSDEVHLMFVTCN